MFLSTIEAQLPFYACQSLALPWPSDVQGHCSSGASQETLQWLPPPEDHVYTNLYMCYIVPRLCLTSLCFVYPQEPRIRACKRAQ